MNISLECLFGRPPFSFISMEDLIYQIRSNNPIEVEAWRLICVFLRSNQIDSTRHSNIDALPELTRRSVTTWSESTNYFSRFLSSSISFQRSFRSSCSRCKSFSNGLHCIEREFRMNSTKNRSPTNKQEIYRKHWTVASKHLMNMLQLSRVCQIQRRYLFRYRNEF